MNQLKVDPKLVADPLGHTLESERLHHSNWKTLLLGNDKNRCHLFRDA